MYNERSDGGMGEGLEDNLEPVTNQEDVVEIENESVEESVRRAVEGLKDTTEQEIVDEPISTPTPVKEASTVQPKNPVGRPPKEKEIDPPGSYKLEEKEDFNRIQSPKQKEAIKRLVNSYKAERDTFVHDYKQYKSALDVRAKDIDTYEAMIKEHLPTWGAQGYTPIQAIAGLVQAQNHIINNPKDAIRNLIKSTGVTQYDLFGDEAAVDVTNSSNNIPDINNHPVVKSLVQEIQNLRGEIQPVINSRRAHEEYEFNAGVDQIVNEISSVRNEKDFNGRYKYPKLHDESFLKSVNSLVSGIKEASPNITWGEATKRAYLALDGQPQNSIQTRPQAQQVVRSVGSMRGVGVGSSRPANTEVPDSVADSVRMAVQQLTRGSY